MTDDTNALFSAARQVRKNAYARYSHYYVGAAILDEAGNSHVGCNVENAAFPQGCCAEASAISAMVSAGFGRIVAIAVVGGPGGDEECAVADADGKVDACTPCGGCRQRILEFSDAETRILLLDEDDAVTSYGMSDLLPAPFHG